MKKSFTESHLTLAHTLWKKHLRKGDLTVDATCGNGKDSLMLAKLGMEVVAIDIQSAAITKAQNLLQGYQVQFYHQSHASFPPLERPPRLIIYNLGYLPGGDHLLTTAVSSTLESVKKALSLLAPDGMLCITCYPGHAEGKREEEALLEFFSPLPCTYYKREDRPTAPSCLVVEKIVSENS